MEARNFVISTVPEALDLLESLWHEDDSAFDSPFSLTLSGELETFDIRIFGPDYHGELTGELARGIAVFQDEIYRATLNVLNSMGAEQGRLNASQKELVALKMEVQENCTLIEFNLDKLSKGLIEVLKGMPPKTVAIIIIAIAAVAGVAYVASDLGGKYIEANQTIATQQEDTKRQETHQQEETKRHEAHARNMDRLITVLDSKLPGADPQAAHATKEFSAATHDGVREIAVRATNATAVRVGNLEIDEQGLQELRKRSPRTSPDKLDIVEPFRIVRFHKGTPSKLLVSGRSLTEVSVDLDETEFQPSKLDSLYAAFKDGKAINLSLTLLVSGEKVKSAVVVDIEP